MITKNLTGSNVWELVTKQIDQKGKIKSSRGIIYKSRFDADNIYYKGGDRNKGEEESIAKKDFIQAFEAVKNLDKINTNTIKKLVPTSIYRKRTPFIAMLHMLDGTN